MIGHARHDKTSLDTLQILNFSLGKITSAVCSGSESFFFLSILLKMKCFAIFYDEIKVCEN